MGWLALVGSCHEQEEGFLSLLARRLGRQRTQRSAGCNDLCILPACCRVLFRELRYNYVLVCLLLRGIAFLEPSKTLNTAFSCSKARRHTMQTAGTTAHLYIAGRLGTGHPLRIAYGAGPEHQARKLRSLHGFSKSGCCLFSALQRAAQADREQKPKRLCPSAGSACEALVNRLRCGEWNENSSSRPQ